MATIPEEKTESKSETTQVLHTHNTFPSIGWLLIILGVIAVVFITIFAAIGMRVHRTIATARVEQGIVRQMPNGRAGFMRRGFAPANRILGAVTKIDGNTLTVHVHQTDQTVVVSSTTSFYNQGAIAKQSDLQVNDVVLVQGTPNSSGQIQATVVEIQ